MRLNSAILYCVAFLLLLTSTASAASSAKAAGTAKPAAGSTQQQRGMLMRWFNKMDVDKDGELQAGELRDFIGAQLGTADFNTGRKLDRAIAQVTCRSRHHAVARRAETNMHSHVYPASFSWQCAVSITESSDNIRFG
jgi:hypothetical protein